jgi:hypothetical protein
MILKLVKKRSPYYGMVPKDFDANLRFREEMIREAAKSKRNREDLWIMCSRDLLFYLNTFSWTYNPKKKWAKVLPMITWKFQDDGLLAIDDAIGSHDCLIEKSRDMGVTWMSLLVMEWRWHFREMESFLMVSRKEDLVDKKGDPKSIFWKIDFALKHQPKWLKPRMDRKKLHLENLDNGSTIDGESTTGDVARGDRRTAVFLDEFASVENGEAVESATRDATDCRVFNSTPKGVGNAFYTRREQMMKENLTVLRFHWSDHPEKSAGLYFDEEGKPRSPWYDLQCKRAVHKMEIAQELDIDYLGSDYQFFDAAILDKHEREFCRIPFLKGDLRFEPDTCIPKDLMQSEKGCLKLWIYPDANDNMPTDRSYVVGVDIATGTGASNSVISVVDQKTGEKVAEYASSIVSPETLASQALAICKWFEGIEGDGAFLIWEANGPGRIFGERIIDLGYRNIYYRRNEQTLSHDPTDIPGWFSSANTKLQLLGDYRRALSEGSLINRHKLAINECREWIYTQNGTVEHVKAVNSFDPSGAKDNHGDRVIADALCWRAMRSVLELPEAEEEVVVPVGSFMWRRNLRLEEAKTEEFW